MGDASSKIEEVGVWEQVDVLKVAHHGSKTSTSLKILEQVKPIYAMISAGNNKFPSEEVLGRLKESNIKEENTYITKRDGANRKVSLMESNRALYFLGTK